MTARDSNRMWGAGRCAQLSRLDHDDGLTCGVHNDSPCVYDIAPRKPWLTVDHWLLIVCMAVLAFVLAVAYTVGQQSRCDRLAAAGDPAAATYCPEETR